MQPDLDRRRAVLGGLSALAGVAFASRGAHAAVSLLASRPLRLEEEPRTLLVLQLAGGNDGLSTIVPHGDDAYYRARPRLAIDREKILRLDEYRGLNPDLARLRAHYEAGHVAIVEGAGYPDPIRSHFKSFDVWHAADPRGRTLPEGWLGRLARVVGSGPASPNLQVHVGSSVPYSLHSTTHPPISFVTPDGYRWAGSSSEVEAFEEAGAMAPQAGQPRQPAPAKGSGSRPTDAPAQSQEPALAFLRQVLSDGQASSEAIRRAAARYRTRIEYPDDALSAALRDIAALVNGDVGSRILSCELGGCDTHTVLANRHARLMQQLDAALSAFLEDLERSEAGRRCVVLVFSEFGRRVTENGSRGNDHGTAGPMLVAGHAVKGGLYGRHPALDDLDDGDLRFTTDFRSVYATVIERWFGARHELVLSQRFELLPFL